MSRQEKIAELESYAAEKWPDATHFSRFPNGLLIETGEDSVRSITIPWSAVDEDPIGILKIALDKFMTT